MKPSKGYLKANIPVPPMVARAEKTGLPPIINGKCNKYGFIPKSGYGFGGYLIGFKLASKMKNQLRQFFLDCNKTNLVYRSRALTAKDSRALWYMDFSIDWSNPYTFKAIHTPIYSAIPIDEFLSKTSLPFAEELRMQINLQ